MSRLGMSIHRKEKGLAGGPLRTTLSFGRL
jgi:hypothetical protein